jgi:hypothetical protein
VSICESIDLTKVSPADQYWIAATLEEAYFGLGETTPYEKAKSTAARVAPESWMRSSTKEQLEKLRKLLERKGHRPDVTSE